MFLLLSYNANATTYYVSNVGSNAANGTSTSTTWQTVAKVSSYSLSPGFNPGDQILFKKGDTWNEALPFYSSGSAGNPITIGSYGSGNKPVFTGLQTLTGFVNTSGNTWTVTASNAAADLNVVLINGVVKAKGRYPNTGTLTYNSVISSQSKIVINGSSASNYIGAEIVIGPLTWVTDVCPVRSQIADSLYISPALTYGTATNKYFLQNLPSFLDVAGEWAFDSTTKVLSVYSVGSPSDVQISTIDTLVSLHLKDYITFDGIQIIGANNVGICKDTSNHVTIQNCTINYTGGNNPLPITKAGQAGGAIRGENAAYSVTKNDSILNSLNNAIFDIHGSSYDSVYNNYIKNTSILIGMGASGNGAGIAVFVQGSHATITNNLVDSVAYNGIWFESADISLIKNNYVTNFCYNKSDGGGIYTDNATSQGSIVRSNIVSGGLGGVAGNVNLSPGIYLDNNAAYITVDSNTIDNCYLRGLLLNIASSNNTVKNNTVRNNSTGHGMYFDDTRANVTVTDNVFYSTDSTKAALFVNSLSAATTTLNNNYYLCPVKESTKLWRGVNNKYSLQEWIDYWTAYSFDVHSHNSPEGITSAAGALHINPTSTPVTTYISGLYKDAKGVEYNNSITIAPYQSAILFKADHEITVNNVLLQTFKLIQQ